MMSNKVLLSLATVALFVATAQATNYAVETTNSWFRTAADEANWTGEGVVVTNGTDVVCVDTAADNAATNSISAVPTGVSNVRITGSIAKLCLNASVPAEYSDPLPQAAITAVDEATDPDAWYVWHCTDTGSGAWVQMTSDTPPVENSSYDITIEFKNGYVRYAVDGTWLTNNENQWITNAQNFAAITKVGLAGFGQFGEVAGLTFESFEVTVSDADLAKYGIDSEKDMAAELNAPGANGYPKWQSIVLGLKDSVSQPYLAPVQNTDPGKVTLSLGGVSPKEGYNVTYAVETYNSLDGTKQGTTGNIDAVGTVDVTPGDSAVKYYKIKITISK